jgi:hypothetical protein
MTNETKSTWFDIDRTGLSKILKRKGIEFAVFELIQNAWDEAGVSRVEATLKPADERGCAWLTVQDDAPEGFKDLRHAYTLFAESAKKGNSKQRGRFNIGEKLVLSLCREAVITTTKGTVLFNKDGTRSESNAKFTDTGSIFKALIHMDADDIKHVEREIGKLIPQEDIKTTFNGKLLEFGNPRWSLEATLPTEVADAEGALRRTTRKTQVRCYDLRDGESAMIYEMGIPVVEHDCAFHVDVLQKVELTLDRENVTPSFLKALRTAVFNATFETLTSDEVNAEWVQTAIESGNAKTEAVEDYMQKRFGEKRASFDMSDPEANRAAVANGYTIVHGSMLSKAAWASVRDAKSITPAGQIFPTHSDSFVAHEAADESDGMEQVREYAQKLAKLLLGCEIVVEFGEQKSREAACWGNKRLQFNVTNLGKAWFDLEHNRLAIDDLIIHEFAHHYSCNHLSEDYYHALSRLAAQAMQLGREGRLP